MLPGSINSFFSWPPRNPPPQHFYLPVIYGHAWMKGSLESTARYILPQIKPEFLFLRKEQCTVFGWKPVAISTGIQSGFFSSPPKKQLSTSQPQLRPLNRLCHSSLLGMLSYFTSKIALGLFLHPWPYLFCFLYMFILFPELSTLL